MSKTADYQIELNELRQQLLNLPEGKRWQTMREALNFITRQSTELHATSLHEQMMRDARVGYKAWDSCSMILGQMSSGAIPPSQEFIRLVRGFFCLT